MVGVGGGGEGDAPEVGVGGVGRQVAVEAGERGAEAAVDEVDALGAARRDRRGAAARRCRRPCRPCRAGRGRPYSWVWPGNSVLRRPAMNDGTSVNQSPVARPRSSAAGRTPGPSCSSIVSSSQRDGARSALRRRSPRGKVMVTWPAAAHHGEQGAMVVGDEVRSSGEVPLTPGLGERGADPVGEQRVVATAGGVGALGQADEDDDVELETEGHVGGAEEDAVAEGAVAADVVGELELESAAESSDGRVRVDAVEVAEAVDRGVDALAGGLLVERPVLPERLAAEVGAHEPATPRGEALPAGGPAAGVERLDEFLHGSGAARPPARPRGGSARLASSAPRPSRPAPRRPRVRRRDGRDGWPTGRARRPPRRPGRPAPRRRRGRAGCRHRGSARRRARRRRRGG